MERTHGKTHWDPDGCYGCKMQTVCIGLPKDTPSRGGHAHVVAANDAEAKLAKDAPAFEKLRKDGYNPKTINGCAELEKRVESSFEIAVGKTASEMGALTPSYQRGDPGSRRDVETGGKEYRRRAVEAQEALDKGDLAFHDPDGGGRRKGLPV